MMVGFITHLRSIKIALVFFDYRFVFFDYRFVFFDYRFFLRLFYEVLLKGAITERFGLHYPNFLPHMFDYNKKFIRFLTFRCYLIK